MHPAYKLYSIINNLPKILQKRGQRIAQLTLKTYKIGDLRNEASDLFYDCLSVKASKREFISNPSFVESENILTTNRYFQVDGQSTKDIIPAYQSMISE